MIGHLAKHPKLRLLIDTCSLMHPQIRTFCERHLAPMVEISGQYAVVPTRVVEEVKKHRKNPAPNVREAADRAYEMVGILKERLVIRVIGGDDDTFADNLFQTIITRDLLKADFLLITQDKDLATDSLWLNHRKSVQTKHRVFVARIGNDGRLEEWALQGSGVRVVPPSQHVDASEKFALRAGAVTVEDAPLTLSVVPQAGHWLYDQEGNRVMLGPPVAPPGGEGAVHATDRGLVCKIYRPERLRASTLAKLRLMISKPIMHASICWPRGLVFNDKQEFAGYLMGRASGKNLDRVLGESYLEKTFPQWNRVHLTTLALSVLEAIQFLHTRNVLLGDINLHNFLIEDEQRISLVDADSFQIEGFPCGVGQAPFVAPELLDQNLSRVLRTFENEHFAVATLVFMILMPGQSPYAHEGGGTPAENVRKGHFPYSRNKDHPGRGAPKGRWTNIWSYFPLPLKETFHRVFTDGQRLSTAAWIKTVGNYLANMAACPPGGREIWPEAVKSIQPKAGEGQTCVRCSKSFSPFGDKCARDHPPLCLGCHEEPMPLKCVFDDVVFSVPFARSLRIKAAVCPQCLSKPPIVKQCKDCGKTFEINMRAQAFFKEKGQTLPKRCPDCRQQKRAAAAH
jgi:hypothetical protein